MRTDEEVKALETYARLANIAANGSHADPFVPRVARRLHIGAREYKIFRSHDVDGHDNYGHADYRNEELRFSENINPRTTARTFFHEVTHTIDIESDTGLPESP